ncbi:hypothetical protein BH11CYA1_BH11CYA1_45990 [soil metagenome]
MRLAGLFLAVLRLVDKWHVGMHVYTCISKPPGGVVGNACIYMYLKA